jgi:hypothetical protein
MEIWNGTVMRAMRDLLNRGRRDLIHLCSRCDAYQDVKFVGFDADAPPVRSAIPLRPSAAVLPAPGA